VLIFSLVVPAIFDPIAYLYLFSQQINIQYNTIFLTKSQVKFERAFFEIVRNSVTLDINRLTIAMCTMSL